MLRKFRALSGVGRQTPTVSWECREDISGDTPSVVRWPHHKRSGSPSSHQNSWGDEANAFEHGLQRLKQHALKATCLAHEESHTRSVLGQMVLLALPHQPP